MSSNKSMSQQMSSLRDQIITKKRNELKSPKPSPMNWGNDGDDHINVWEYAQTELGKFLAHSSPYKFKHKYFGSFNSLEAFWHYIQSAERDDRIRVMHGPTLRTFVKKLTPAKVPNFRAIIMDSNWQRVRQHKDKMQMLAESNLPFDCYYISRSTQMRVRPTFFAWLIMGFEEIRAAVKEGREPIFDFLLDHENSEIYQYVLPKIEVPQPIAVLSDSQAAAIIDHIENSLVGDVVELIEA